VSEGVADVSLAKASRWDDVAVGIFVEGERFRDEPEGIEPELLAGVKISVPLPFWESGSNRISEKEAAAERKRSDLEALRLEAANEAAAARQVMEVRFRAAKEFEGRLVPAARNNLADAEEAGRKAEAGIDVVIRAREALSGLEVAAIEARKNYFLAYVAWLAAVGDRPTNP
jgi:cobalt-zinc-cadmium efflux system outer membrane protein